MKKVHFFILLLVAAGVISGCSPKIATSTYKSEAYLKLSDKTPPTQSKGGITIEVKLPSESDYKNPVFNKQLYIKIIPAATTVNMKLDSEGYFDIIENVNLQFYFDLTPFKVVISNNTDHILRLKDSRIVFIDNNSEDPFRGLTKNELIQDITQLPIYQLRIKELKEKYPRAKPGNIEAQLRMALLDIINDLKIINNFDNEIIPEMKSSGVIIFPVSTKKLSEGKVSFVDFISRTDAAGNAIEKVRFDYETILSTKYFKGGAPVGIGSNLKSSWIEISKDDFIKGQTNPDKYYYDKTQKKWISGAAPKK